MKILLTTTSYQDCPGDHHALLDSTGAEIVRERGPLSEARMLELAGDFERVPLWRRRDHTSRDRQIATKAKSHCKVWVSASTRSTLPMRPRIRFRSAFAPA